MNEPPTCAQPVTPLSFIDVYADVLCPFTHVGLRRIVTRRTELGLDAPVLRVHAWPLELVNGEPLAATLVADEVGALREAVAPDLFRGFDGARFPSTSLPALALTARAYRAGDAVGERCSLALRDALFEDGLDVSDPEVLASIAETFGIDGATPDDLLSVTEDLDHGRVLGAVGSPHFFVAGDDFFCPSLDIHHDDDGHLQVQFDAPAFAAFTARCFGEDVAATS